MNYYPFHIGDFAAHTSHLSLEEDLAYRRMLDWYYLNEKSLPGDAQKISRLIRMPKSIKAIEVVLEEFFTLSDDGYHNKRADQELTSMISKQEQQSTKDAHEAERMKRYRERRSVMFEALRAHNVVPAWDVPMKELQRLYDATCNGPAADLQREHAVSVNANATAIPTPTPTPTPTPINKNTEKAQAPAAYGDLLVGVDEQVLADWFALRKSKKAPITRTAVEGLISEAQKAGMTIEAAMRVSCANGWQGFKADWVVKPLQAKPPTAPAMTFKERDDANARKRWEEMTGRTHPDNQSRAFTGNVIDATAKLIGAQK